VVLDGPTRTDHTSASCAIDDQHNQKLECFVYLFNQPTTGLPLIAAERLDAGGEMSDNTSITDYAHYLQRSQTP
jgi:hypothetical protein